MQIKITNTRAAFAKFFKAETVNGEGEPKYGACFLLDPKDPQVAMINKAIDAVATEKWGAKAAAMLTLMRKTDKTALHDGDLKAQYQGFPGMVYVSANSALRPIVVDRDKTPLTAEDGKPYGGCYVNVTVELWAQDNSYGKRVNAGLLAVQFVKDGDSFGGARAGSADDFEDLAVGADEDSLV
jgi:hypothetical protein